MHLGERNIDRRSVIKGIVAGVAGSALSMGLDCVLPGWGSNQKGAEAQGKYPQKTMVTSREGRDIFVEQGSTHSVLVVNQDPRHAGIQEVYEVAAEVEQACDGEIVFGLTRTTETGYIVKTDNPNCISAVMQLP